MLYIKLDDGMNLSITVNEPIYRGDNLSRKITYLIPAKVGEIDMLTASVFLSYVRADGTADIVTLERGADKYKEAYFQYTIPVTCKLTKYPGEVCTWLQIYAGPPSNPTIAKSSACMLYVQASKNMDDCLCDHQLTAIYQMQQKIDSAVEENNAVYVPHISERKILTYTIEDKPDGVPEPVDLNPHDEWANIDDSEIVSDYIWEQL